MRLLLLPLAPADGGVVGAGGDFPVLRGIRNYAHLGAVDVVEEGVLATAS